MFALQGRRCDDTVFMYAYVLTDYLIISDMILDSVMVSFKMLDVPLIAWLQEE